MKKFIFVIISLCLFAGCFEDSGGGGSDDPVVKTFKGWIEKGALQKGATITASEWSPTTGYSGKVYAAETLDNKGGYEISSSGLTGILDIKADGPGRNRRIKMIYIVSFILLVYCVISYHQGYNSGYKDGIISGIFRSGGDLKDE